MNGLSQTMLGNCDGLASGQQSDRPKGCHQANFHESNSLLDSATPVLSTPQWASCPRRTVRHKAIDTAGSTRSVGPVLRSNCRARENWCGLVRQLAPVIANAFRPARQTMLIFSAGHRVQSAKTGAKASIVGIGPVSQVGHISQDGTILLVTTPVTCDPPQRPPRLPSAKGGHHNPGDPAKRARQAISRLSRIRPWSPTIAESVVPAGKPRWKHQVLGIVGFRDRGPASSPHPYSRKSGAAEGETAGHHSWFVRNLKSRSQRLASREVPNRQVAGGSPQAPKNAAESPKLLAAKIRTATGNRPGTEWVPTETNRS